MTDKKICLIFLAAGESRRFGNENKLMALFKGKPLFLHGLSAAISSGIGDIIIVSSGNVAMSKEIEDMPVVSREYKVRRVINLNPSEGISSSIRLGLKAAGEEYDAYMFLVADQPHITPSTIRGMAASFFTCGRGIEVLSAGGRRGNPVIFHKGYYRELMELTGDTGGKALIMEYPDDVSEYETENCPELTDYDTPWD